MIAVAAAALLLAAGGIAVGVLTRPGADCQETLVPAYFYPGTGWDRAIASRPPPGMMILDVTSSGAGRAPDRAYQATVRRAQAAGITIMGYASTDYAHRPAAAVEADVTHYRAWYHVTDIFLDEASSGVGAAAYYQQLASYIHRAAPGSKVMLNPGTYPDRRYMSIGDIVLVYEDSYANFRRLQVPGWAAAYPAARFADAVYATSRSQLSSVISLSRRRHAGYLYVTGDSGGNPYRSLPSYWAAENAIIARCAGG